MPKRITGQYERSRLSGEEVAAFVPFALPPADPPLAMTAVLVERLRAAEQALGRLELAGEMVPSLDWFIDAFVRKEAVVSSQIEGTQATLVDLFSFEAQVATAEGEGEPSADVGSDPANPRRFDRAERDRVWSRRCPDRVTEPGTDSGTA